MSAEIKADAQRVISKLGNAFVQAFVTLDMCLLNNGALKPGEFSEALKDTFNHPGADLDSLDCMALQILAKQIDEAEARDRNTP